MTFDPEYRMVTLFFSLIFIKKSKIGILEPNILAGTRDPLSISTPYWGPNYRSARLNAKSSRTSVCETGHRHTNQLRANNNVATR